MKQFLLYKNLFSRINHDQLHHQLLSLHDVFNKDENLLANHLKEACKLTYKALQSVHTKKT